MKNKYRVFGTTAVTVVIEVTADSEMDAYREARKQLSELKEFAGNGGTEKLIGVSGDNQSVYADEKILWNDTEKLD